MKYVWRTGRGALEPRRTRELPESGPLAPGEMLDLRALIAAVEHVVTDLDPEPLALPAAALEDAARSLRQTVPTLEAVRRRLAARSIR